MRIIAGIAKGRKLSSQKNSNARPTLDRVKEAVFSMIAPYIVESNVLDLFAGFGGLGLEAVSRGAQKATLVEKNYKNSKIIGENIDICKFKDSTDLQIDDVFSFITNSTDKYDLIFMDPPYNKGYEEKTLLLIHEYDLIKENGLVIIEHSKRDSIDDLATMTKIKEKQYGDTAITVLQQREEE
jgi:16S rRNA (guanine966-N2)-methyltransferase